MGLDYVSLPSLRLIYIEATLKTIRNVSATLVHAFVTPSIWHQAVIEVLKSCLVVRNTFGGILTRNIISYVNQLRYVLMYHAIIDEKKNFIFISILNFLSHNRDILLLNW